MAVDTDTQVSTEAFVNSVREASTGDIPDPARFMSKRLIKDLIGISIAGQKSPQLDTVVHFAQTQYGDGAASIYGVEGKISPVGAALANGTTGHGHDFDDTYDPSPIHCSSSIIPAALAVGQEVDATGEDLLRAVALAFDVHTRLTLACNTGGQETGWHRSATFGTFSATVASSLLLELSTAEMVNALGIAYCQVAGNAQVYRDKSVTKRFQPGHASMAGVTAALLARDGLTATEDPLFGSYGFYDVYEPDYSLDDILVDLGEEFYISDFSLKPYPSCRLTHATIDAGLALRDRLGIALDDVDSALVEETSTSYGIVCKPDEKIYRPSAMVELQFNNPYTLAVALAEGRPTLENFTEQALERDEIISHLPKIDTAIADDFSEFENKVSPSRVTVTTADGRTETVTVTEPKGHPNNRLSAAEVDRKVRECIQFGAPDIDDDAIDLVIERVDDLDAVSSVDDILDPLQ